MRPKLNVKANDSVIIWRANDAPVQRFVDRVTPSGRFHAGGYEFNPDGKQRGSYVAYPARAVLATPDEIARMEKERAAARRAADRSRTIGQIRNAPISRLTDDQLARIVAILNEEPAP